jgi:hypothetical protein
MFDGHARISVDVKQSKVIRRRNQLLVLTHVNRVDMSAILTDRSGPLDIPPLLDGICGPNETFGVLHPVIIEFFV